MRGGSAGGSVHRPNIIGDAEAVGSGGRQPDDEPEEEDGLEEDMEDDEEEDQEEDYD